MPARVPDPEKFVTGRMTDVGQVRTVNQDYCDEFFDAASGRRLLVLADGMGGHRGGEVASRLAVEAVGRVFAAAGDDAGRLLRTALEEANRLVYEKALASAGLAGMGTTSVCLLFETGGRGWVAHVGDSRAYQLRNGKFTQLTEDHSVVGALIRMGRITEEQARLHPQRNEILRAIGTNDRVEAEVKGFELEPGDRYLLCSDGLSGLVADDEIAQILATEEPDRAVRTLVELANLEGGTDNITVQVSAIPEIAFERTSAANAHPGAARNGPSDGKRTERLPNPSERRGPTAWLLVGGAALCLALGWWLLH